MIAHFCADDNLGQSSVIKEASAKVDVCRTWHHTSVMVRQRALPRRWIQNELLRQNGRGFVCSYRDSTYTERLYNVFVNVDSEEVSALEKPDRIKNYTLIQLTTLQCTSVQGKMIAINQISEVLLNGCHCRK